MRKQWIAVLSMLGLTGSALPVQSQVLKGKESVAKESAIKNAKTQAAANAAAQQRKDKWSKTTAEGNLAHKGSKLNVNQQTLRQQNGAVKGNGAVNTYAGKNALTKGNNGALTKANNGAITKGSNSALTKGSNSALTKGNNSALTKAKTGAR